MRTLLGLLAVSLSLVTLNGCADAPAPTEEQGGTESNLSSRPSRARKPAESLNLGSDDPNPANSPAAQEAELPVLVTWNGVANTEASLDLVLNTGEIVGPCVAVDILRDEFQRGLSDGLGYLYTGTCPSAPFDVAPNLIRAFRICSATNNDWANATCTEGAPWDHTTAPVHINN